MVSTKLPAADVGSICWNEAVNKDLSFKAKAKDLTQNTLRTAFDYGVRENKTKKK